MRYKIKISYKTLIKEGGFKVERDSLLFESNIEMKQSIDDLKNMNQSEWLKRYREVNAFDVKIVSIEDTKYSK